MSSRAIGELLHIGERTVESHLARVYLKFGVHSRQQTAEGWAEATFRLLRDAFITPGRTPE